jgi:hypothetical protein
VIPSQLRSLASACSRAAEEAVSRAPAVLPGWAVQGIGTAAGMCRAGLAAGAALTGTARAAMAEAEAALTREWPALQESASGATQVLTDAGPRRSRRRVWHQDGHAAIEVRGLSGRGPAHHRLAGGCAPRCGASVECAGPR